MSNLISHVRAAAERGEAGAQFNLAVFYDNGLDDNGHDAARDRREAIKWLRKAAAQGLARAQCKLAEIYTEQSDLRRAYAWLLVATANPDNSNGEHVHTKMARIAGRLTADQIERANKLARIWTAKIRALAPSEHR